MHAGGAGTGPRRMDSQPAVSSTALAALRSALSAGSAPTSARPPRPGAWPRSSTATSVTTATETTPMRMSASRSRTELHPTARSVQVHRGRALRPQDRAALRIAEDDAEVRPRRGSGAQLDEDRLQELGGAERNLVGHRDVPVQRVARA